jgi:hypothetical protein
MVDQDSTPNAQGDAEDQMLQDDDDKAAFPGSDAGDAPVTSEDSPELPDTTDENDRPVENPSG